MADARVVGDLVGVDLVGVGGDVVQRVELVDAGAGDAEGEPGEHASGQHDQGHQHGEDRARLERGDPDQHRAGHQDRADDDGRDGQRAAVLQAHHGDQAHGEDAEAGVEQRVGEEGVVQRPAPRGQVTRGEEQPGDAGVERGEQRDGHAGLRLLLGTGEHDAADDQQAGDHRGGHAAEQALALQEEGQGAQAEQDAARAQRRTTSCRRLPRLELVLDHVGHRLDHVVVHAGRLVVDAGRDGQQSAVLDALHGESGVVDQDPALLRHQAVAAVDRGGVEEADGTGQLGDELGDRDRARQHQINPSRPRGDGHPDQARGDRGPLTHWLFPLIVLPLHPPERPGH